MISLPGYTVKEKIHSGEKSIIYRGMKADGLTPIIIKILNSEYPSPSELTSFRTEFDVLQKVRGKFIISAVGVEKYANSLAIILDDIGGEAVSKLLKEGLFSSLERKIQVMLLAAEGLEEIHANQAVHKDIKPQNMVINLKTSEFRYIDFGSASFISRQTSYVSLNSSLEGTLPYVSPEQTGRMNRTIDYRSDYYSLGVTYYQILTGLLPFAYSDPMEMIHAHIAKMPVSPYERSGVPRILSDIVMKLLRKMPEDRYQSTEGILSDLRKCRDLLLMDGEAALKNLIFNLGENDHSGRFQIPEKLYGRSKEILHIIRNFKKSAEGTAELLLISGRSGIGKSALVNEINKPIVEYKGYFASGKYDQYKRTIPYRAFSQVFQSLIGQILAGSSESVKEWKTRLSEALGQNGKIITDMIPELESLIGLQQSVPDLPPAESENRFNLVFQSFIKAFCTEKNPIAVFLDDVQWADLPSLKMIQNLFLTKEIKYFFLMLSFRDNEVLPSDPFSIMLDDLKKSGRTIDSIVLESLEFEDVRTLVEDTLGQKNGTEEIASVLMDKTKGNPFFVNELFRSLADKELIRFRSGKWQWDIKEIKSIRISENVIDLMIEKIQELPESQIRLLKLAACVGDWFRIDVFSEISSVSLDALNKDITELSNDGFLVVGGNIVKFVHDKIREAVYTLISEEEKSLNHYNIGKTYLQMTSDSEADDLVFTIVNQLNQGTKYVKAGDESQKLLLLNIKAGKKSLASAAYEAGLVFYKSAELYLSPDVWSNDYQFALDFYVNLAKAEYLSKQYDAAEKTFDSVLERARTINDKTSVYEMKSSMYVSQNRILETLAILKQALKTLGLNLPKNPSEVSPLPEVIKFKIKFGKKQISVLEKLPPMKDESAIAAMHLLNACIAPSFISQPNLFPVVVLKMVNMSLIKGNYYLSPFAYTTFGLIQGSGLGDFKAGYDFGKLGLSLINIIGGKTSIIACRTNFIFATMVSHWREHAKSGRSFFIDSIQSGQISGDLQYASYSVNHINF
ncbi:MAG TPA: serine/threonine-protein kinase PknK, partial [Leptospiraceae bacterium]|nr:serine/threonine-protein kinase PknK [Leptospiraceae bacterium]